MPLWSGELRRMRDKILEESLKRLAAETSTRFSALVATGDEIPFDVAENDGESSHFYRYVPLTAGYVESRFEEVRSLPSYGPARGAVVAAGVSATFLESKGLQVPADPAARADEMIRVFISELWEGASEFSLNLSRIEAILDEIDRRNAEEEAQKRQTAMWVCLGHSSYGCDQTFSERPTVCPRCGKDHSLRR